MNNNEIERKLLYEGGPDAYEKFLEDNIKREIEQAKREREKKLSQNKVIITDIKKLKPEQKFDKQSVYKVFNRKQKTETYVCGEQAENMMKYTDDYIVRFDHRCC